MDTFFAIYLIWVTIVFLSFIIIWLIDEDDLEDIIFYDVCESDDRQWWCTTKKVIRPLLIWPGYLPFYLSRFRFLFKQKDL